jgi:hypothetical protein
MAAETCSKPDAVAGVHEVETAAITIRQLCTDES